MMVSIILLILISMVVSFLAGMVFERFVWFAKSISEDNVYEWDGHRIKVEYLEKTE